MPPQKTAQPWHPLAEKLAYEGKGDIEAHREIQLVHPDVTYGQVHGYLQRMRNAKRQEVAISSRQSLRKAFRIGIFDLECTNLNADFGYLLCGVIKDYNDPEPRVFRVDDQVGKQPAKCSCGLRHWDDFPLAQRLRDELESYDMLVSYNGLSFDIPFLNARLFFGGERGVRDIKHIDLLLKVRKAVKLHNNRLDTLARHLQLDVQKTPLEGPAWVAAAGGCKTSLDQVVEHCVADVFVLEAAFEKLRGQLQARFF